MKTRAPGPWEIREALTTDRGDYYTVSRVVDHKRVHLEYASNGKPMLWSREQADAAIKKANNGRTS